MARDRNAPAGVESRGEVRNVMERHGRNGRDRSVKKRTESQWIGRSGMGELVRNGLLWQDWSVRQRNGKNGNGRSG